MRSFSFRRRLCSGTRRSDHATVASVVSAWATDESRHSERTPSLHKARRRKAARGASLPVLHSPLPSILPPDNGKMTAKWTAPLPVLLIHSKAQTAILRFVRTVPFAADIPRVSIALSPFVDEHTSVSGPKDFFSAATQSRD